MPTRQSLKIVMFKWSRLLSSPRGGARLASIASEFSESRQVPGDEGLPSQLRGPVSGQDLTLTGHTIAWIERLPAAIRPDRLSVDYPRVANRLALCWDDTRLTERVFTSLAKNTRTRRTGFPAAVAAELEQLRLHHDQRTAALAHEATTAPPQRNALAEAVASNPIRAACEAWEIHAQATSDR
jgi:hypothetical protein